MPASKVPAIRVSGLGKTYRIGTDGDTSSTAAEAFVRWLRNPTQRHWTTFDALDDVSFEVPQGEALGIVGRNGAGKSTLLKLLTRVTAPTRGRIDLTGRVGSLLEVGTGFHPELTGRENIFLNGALLGMTRAEINRRYDEIVDFSGVEKFLETPVKRYSSGMYVRLAFAIAAHLDTEILLIDEVLAVGDAEFQRRSLGKMRDAAQSGRTVLYVSHLLHTVRDLCTSAILLEHGHLTFAGNVDDTLAAYQHSFASFAERQTNPDNRMGYGDLRFQDVSVTAGNLRSGEDIVVEYSVGQNDDLPGEFYVSAHLTDEGGATVVQCDSRLVGHWLSPKKPHDGQLVIRNLWLKPGQYTVDMFVCTTTGVQDMWEGAGRFDVRPELPYKHSVTGDGMSRGAVFADFDYQELP
ncbi:MAG TPA: polysaccharide ABC transporter ATP-binding protein [Cellulomonas sp.]